MPEYTSNSNTEKDSKFNRELLPTPFEYYKNIAGFNFKNTTGWASVQCPFHNDKTASFGIDLNTGGFNCFACGAKGGDIISFHMKKHQLNYKKTITALGAIGTNNMINNAIYDTQHLHLAKDFALKISKGKIDSGYEFVDIYPFFDARNNPLYYKYRIEHKVTGEKHVRSISKIDGKFECKEPSFPLVYPEGGGKKPLYHLPEIVNAPSDEVIFVVEGEKKANLLKSFGIIATTSGSATSADKHDWTPLARRIVRIWRDHDEAGTKYQNEVVNILKSQGSVVSSVDVDVLALNPKDDVVDWVNARNALGLSTTKDDILSLSCIQQDEMPAETVNDNIKTYPTIHGEFRLVKNGRNAGVYFIDSNDSATWLSSPIEIIAKTSDKDSNGWGKLLAWTDQNNIKHEWAMPMKLLADGGTDIRRELLDKGVSLNELRIAREKFTTYLQVNVDKHALSVERSGWFEDCYVLPNAVYGKLDKLIVFQGAARLKPAFSQSGTLDEWQQHISKPSIGNSRLVFSLSVAFAGALLDLLDLEGSGFHVRGVSSSGKSTVLELASSVFGSPDKYKRQWRATSNGLEGVAVQYNDGLLVLDELGESNAKEIGNSIYMLFNGKGKVRANQSGDAKECASWRLVVLSSGEESLAERMSLNGERTKAGQQNRLVDIPADAGKSLGIFECLHGAENGSSFSDMLKQASMTYYGTAGHAWLQHLANNRKGLAEQAHDYIKQFLSAHIPKKSDGLVQRVGKRFALVAAAGELATAAGLTGWDEGEATKASARCFSDWLANIGGTGSFEERAILRQVRSFIEMNESSRFEKMSHDPERESDITTHNDIRTNNRVGFVKAYTDKPKEYYIFPEQFKSEVCKGLDFKLVLSVLKEHSWLNCNSQSGATKTVRISGRKESVRMYVLNDSL